ncbi:MAG: endolytic transglycosylase MltG [Chloroflexi bacterium]|nr:endolytic transglycosylase MltG [Chloroflexota bacterium]
MKRTIRRVVAALFAIALFAFVASAFWFVYSLLAPPRDDSGSLLVSTKSFPTPVSVEDTLLGMRLQQRQDELNAPAGTDATPFAFTILPGELPRDVATRLQKQGLIKDADLFVDWIKYLHVGTKIQAGDYVLRRTMTMSELVEALQHGYARAITITVRPGWRAEEVADYLATLGLTKFNKDQFLQSVKTSKFDYEFLRDRPKGAPTTLEGYLFPETYNVPFDTPTDTLLVVILDTFNARVDVKLRQKAAAAKMTLHEVLTLASIIEREAVVANERPIIASVYLNRIKKKMLLQSDPTAQYALGYQTATKQWWKIPVTIEELIAAKSPFNTYLNPGLPPAPICNPSLASITAALEPAQTDYLFFFSKGDGSHAFAKTYEEHLQNQTKYGGK